MSIRLVIIRQSEATIMHEYREMKAAVTIFQAECMKPDTIAAYYYDGGGVLTMTYTKEPAGRREAAERLRKACHHIRKMDFAQALAETYGVKQYQEACIMLSNDISIVAAGVAQ